MSNSSENPSNLIEIPRDGYFNVSIKTIDKLVQNDVNNYIGISGSRLKKKGMFNLSIKQWINKNEKLAPNIYNAIRLITDKKIEIKPIYFDRRYFSSEILDKPWYFTSKERGNQIIKNLKKPEIISIDNQPIYFTQNKNNADFEIYKKYAEITKNKILNFTFHKSKNNNLAYFEEKLIEDSPVNINEKRAMKRALGKLFGNKQIGMVGYKGKNKAVSYVNQEPIKPLIQYTMTDILKSTYCTGFLVENNKYNSELPLIIIDVDIYDKNTGVAKKGWQVVKPLLAELKKFNTFECWNSRTQKYNKKYIFFNPNKIMDLNLLKEYRDFIEILDRATIFTLPGLGDIEYNCNWVKPINFPENIFNKFTL